ncbi:MAG TPA: hypothetical protein VGK67_03920 [Myxococcales bacterium]|jgi:hypothetical protein
MAVRFDFEKALGVLRSAVETERDATAAALAAHGRLGLNTVEALRALQAAAEPWPPRADGRDTACDLVWIAARTPRRVYVPVLEASFANYGAPARVEALRLLLRVGDRRAAEVWLSLATRHGAELTALGLDALLDDPRNLDVIYPAALALLSHPALVAEVGDSTCALCAEGELAPERLSGELERVLAAEEVCRAAMERLRGGAATGWERQAEYLQERSARTALLDLVGWLPGEKAEAAVRRALADLDRRVMAFAVAALLRRNAPVDPGYLAELEADLELRGWLQSRLAGARKQADPADPDDG